MFLPGSPCGCCGGGPCQPCPRCAPLCLTATFSGFAHGTGNCGECDFLDDTTFVLRRPPDPTLSVTASVPSATGSGATFSVTTTRNATDGSYAVTGIKLTNGGANYSLGDAMTFASNGCIVEPPEASITIATTRPVATSLRMTPAVVPSGMAITGVPVTYEQQADEDGNPYWRVASIGSPFFGVGYAEGMAVSLTPGIPSGSNDPEAGVVVQEAATATITQVNRVAPTLQVRITRAGGGSFNSQTVSLSLITDENGRDAWSVTGVAVGWWFPSDFTSSDTVSFITLGTTAITVEAATATMTVDENGAITGFTVTSGGEYYDTHGRPLAVELLTDGRYYKPGVITSVTLDDGGKIFGPNACTYASDQICTVCPATAGDTLFVNLAIGASEHAFRMYRRHPTGSFPPYVDTLLLEATRPTLDEDGDPIPCDKLTFESEHFSGPYSCSTSGTLTIAEGECGDSSRNGCEMPEHVTLSASGVPLIFSHGGAFGGSVSAAFVPDLAKHCDISSYCTISGAAGGGVAGAASISMVSRDESGVVLETGGDCNAYAYAGIAPDLANGAVNNQGNWTTKYCGGDLSGGRTFGVTISPTTTYTNVAVSPPSWGSFGAKAEASVGGGVVTAITVTNPGEGYAREIFERTEPEMTVSLSGGTGSGAVLSATLTQSGTGESATWYVSDVTVTDGGTGHNGLESVVFTPEEGATVESAASAVVLVGRTEPTIAASVSGGSGADLSVTLGISTDWITGQDFWYVDSVSVDDGGAGYADGASVTFTVTDGVQAMAAYATATTGREEPEVTASLPYSSGSGALLTPVLSASGASWTVASITIDDGGTGHSEWDQVLISTDDVEEAGSYFYVSSVDGSGAITGIGSYGGGSYYRSNGIIESVAVSNGGSYYKSNGIVESVLLEDDGSYYLSESTGTADVDTPEVTISSNSGEGATATATVDGTLGSPTFGQVTGISVASGGANYTSAVPGWRITLNYDGLSHASTSDRISYEACPSELLNRSYAMTLTVNSIPGLFGSDCGEPASVVSLGSGASQYTFDGISISVSGA